jgi:hypothetical protein
MITYTLTIELMYTLENHGHRLYVVYVKQF